MSQHDETLRKAMEEIGRLRSEREESLREVASSEYSGRMRAAERIYWVYAIVCVAVGVAAINSFARSFDTKTMIGCAVLMLVVYETTVLLKLWFHTARMKMAVLKEMKLLRLEVSRVATAVGVESPSEPPVKYEPLRGASSWERWLWFAACVVVAIAASSWTARQWHLGGGISSTDKLVTLAADGSAEGRTETVSPYSSYFRPKGFSYHTPKDSKVRFFDPAGHELPDETVVTGTRARHDITFTDSVYDDGNLRYTRVDFPEPAKFKDGVWTYHDGMRVAGCEQEYCLTVVLPPGANFLSADPGGDVEVNKDGRTQVRFQGTTINDKQYIFTVRYEVPSEAAAE